MTEPIIAGPSARPRLQAPLKPEVGFHWIVLVLCSAVLVAAALLSVPEPSRVMLPGIKLPLPALCMSRRMMGIDCPGCGMTRCFVALAHGDIIAGWSFNPAGIWLFAIMAFQVPYRTLQLWRIRRGKPELSLPRTANFALVMFAVALLTQWLVRLSAGWL